MCTVNILNFFYRNFSKYNFYILQCILASIIVVALKGLLVQFMDFFKFWKISRLDAIIWMATFLAVVIVSIDIGLLVGIILSVASIFIRSLKPYTCLLGHVPNTDLYLDIKRYKAVRLIESILILFFYLFILNFLIFIIFFSSLDRLKKLNQLKFVIIAVV